MGLKEFGEVKRNGKVFKVLWLNTSNPEKKAAEEGIKILGREKATFTVHTGEKDIVGNIVKNFLENRPGIENDLEGKTLIVLFKEEVGSAATAEVSAEKRGWVHKTVEALLGVKE